MAELILNLVLGSNSCGITTTNNNNLSILCGINCGIESCFRNLSKGIEFEHPRWAVPKDGLGLADRTLEEFNTLRAAVETHPSVWNTFLISSCPSCCILVEFVCSDIVDRKNNLNIVLLCLCNKISNSLATCLIKQTVTNLDILQCLLK